jgi:ribosomal protein S18 acetylase RimI-like enzyme
MVATKTNGKVNGVGIRPLTLSDAQDLQRNCFPYESPESVTDYVSRAQLLCWRKRAEIGSLVVAEPLRGHGIGTALIEALSDAAAGMGAEQIEIGADVENERVLNLYQRLGFTPYKEVQVPGRGLGDDYVVYLVKPVPPRN